MTTTSSSRQAGYAASLSRKFDTEALACILVTFRDGDDEPTDDPVTIGAIAETVESLTRAAIDGQRADYVYDFVSYELTSREASRLIDTLK